MKLKHSFTIVELLVAIAVIGSMASVVAISINPVKKMKISRDARRKRNISELSNILDAYFTKTDEYPNPCTTKDSDGACASASDWRSADILMERKYTKHMPEDPINNSFESVNQSYGNYSYFIITANTDYLVAEITPLNNLASKTLAASVPGPEEGDSGNYYLLGAFLENRDDAEALGNLSGPLHWPDCTTEIDFASNIYLVRSYKCPNDPHDAP